jgi:hypothetical protein
VERAPVTALDDAAFRLVGELTTVNLLGHIGAAFREVMGAFGLKAPRYSLYDHAPTNYIACSQPNGIVRTEFGNDF